MKRTTVRAALAVFSILAGPLHAESADTIYHNARVVTVDSAFRIVGGLAVKGDRILAAGDPAELETFAGPQTKRVDLQGRTVIPGLIDNHLHFLRDALRWNYQTRIDGVTNRARALDIIAAKARASKEGEWVFVLGGWSEDQFADRPGGFTREELDAAAPQNPVLIQKSYMAVYLNSLAEAALGEGTGGDRGGSRNDGGLRSKGTGGRGKGGGAILTTSARCRDLERR